MNKKGFTLIELIGVVALLGVLIILISPNLVKIIHNVDNDLDEYTKKVLYNGVDQYLEEYEKLLPNGEYKVTINDLISNDIISSNFLEMNNNSISLESCIIVTYTNGYPDYNFYLECPTS